MQNVIEVASPIEAGAVLDSGAPYVYFELPAQPPYLLTPEEANAFAAELLRGSATAMCAALDHAVRRAGVAQ